jgi:hypothetical protein
MKAQPKEVVLYVAELNFMSRCFYLYDEDKF